MCFPHYISNTQHHVTFKQANSHYFSWLSDRHQHAGLCTSCWPPGLLTCSSQGLPMPRLDQMDAARLEWGGLCRSTVQVSWRKNVWECTQTNRSLSLAPWEQEATKWREQEPGWDKQDVAALETRGCRPEGLLLKCLHAFKVDKKSVCKRDPLMAAKQTNHTRLGKSPWAGNRARKHHGCLPCFSSSLGTSGYYSYYSKAGMYSDQVPLFLLSKKIPSGMFPVAYIFWFFSPIINRLYHSTLFLDNEEIILLIRHMRHFLSAILCSFSAANATEINWHSHTCTFESRLLSPRSFLIDNKPLFQIIKGGQAS